VRSTSRRSTSACATAEAALDALEEFDRARLAERDVPAVKIRNAGEIWGGG
jgi:hypothetical protein